MAPKKKGAKKAQDDWENDQGEVADPIAEATNNAKAAEAAEDAAGDDDMGGGLLAALRKNRAKKVKKGKHVEDFVEGEDPTADNDAPALDLAAKAPQEATMDDEDVFGQPVKKGRAVKGKGKPDEEPEDDEERHADGRVKTKKEKEKEKKEREKQRKKEQVSQLSTSSVCWPNKFAGRKEEAGRPRKRSARSTDEAGPKGRTESRSQARTYDCCPWQEEGQCGARGHSEAASGTKETTRGEGEAGRGGEGSHRGRGAPRSRRCTAQGRDQSCEEASRTGKNRPAEARRHV
jgi:translation initiation factor 5B